MMSPKPSAAPSDDASWDALQLALAAQRTASGTCWCARRARRPSCGQSNIRGASQPSSKYQRLSSTACPCQPLRTDLNDPSVALQGSPVAKRHSPGSEKLSIGFLVQNAPYAPQPTGTPSSARRPPAVSAPPLPAGLLAQLPFTTGRSNGRNYHLEVVQQPVRAAELGSSGLSRLPLSPPLVVELSVRDSAGNAVNDETDFPFLVSHLSISHADEPSSPGAPTSPGASQRLLYGTLVSSPHRLRNLEGKMGVYFIFPDVSVRQRGRFRLRITLMSLMSNIPGGPPVVGGGGNVLASARTRSFEVVPTHEYVAPPQTPLTASFIRQGARMSLVGP